MTRKVRWNKHGLSRWAGRKHYVVHLDDTTGPRFEEFRRQRPEIVASRWVGALIEDGMERVELEEKRRRAPANPWERPVFWEGERKR